MARIAKRARSSTSDILDRSAGIVSALELKPGAETFGRVEEFADGLAIVSGLPDIRLGETLIFCDDILGFVLTIEPDRFHAVLLDDAGDMEAGAIVRRTGRLLGVPVGEEMLGRIVDPLGRPLDDGQPVETAASWPVERPAPSIVDRDFVNEPVQTGLLVIDALFAVGRGQRELIIGERATGKTSIGVDTIINQKDSDIISIYVAIGQRTTSVERVIESVREKGAMERSIFVVAPATAQPGLRWLAPFSGTTMAEFFRDRGQHALIVYDDLTKHAETHRELSLLARQPPGREAYPGDIFYLHARLLERSAKLSKAKGGGSLTALPIAEIEAGNLSAYIPTNLISISDGQIVMSAQLFAANQRPAVDVGFSVSRVGGKAQLTALKKVAGQVRLDYAQYLELRMFARFGGLADETLTKRIRHGERISELLAQPRLSPLRTIDQIGLLAALAEGVLDSVPVDQVARMKKRLPAVIDAEPALADCIGNPGHLNENAGTVLLECVRRALSDVVAPAQPEAG